MKWRYFVYVILFLASVLSVNCGEDDFNSQLARGDDFSKSDRYLEAIIQYKQAVSFHPNTDDALKAQIFLKIGLCYTELMNQATEKSESIIHALSARPFLLKSKMSGKFSFRLYKALFAVYSRLDRKQEGLSIISDMIKARPTEPMGYGFLVDYYVKKKKWYAAVEQLQKQLTALLAPEIFILRQNVTLLEKDINRLKWGIGIIASVNKCKKLEPEERTRLLEEGRGIISKFPSLGSLVSQLNKLKKQLSGKEKAYAKGDFKITPGLKRQVTRVYFSLTVSYLNMLDGTGRVYDFKYRYKQGMHFLREWNLLTCDTATAKIYRVKFHRQRLKFIAFENYHLRISLSETRRKSSRRRPSRK